MMATPRREQAPPTDPDVVIPRAVREAAARATTAQQESIGQAEPPVAPDPSAVPPADPPIASAGAPQPPAVGTLPPPAPPQEAQRPVDWEARYKTDFGRLEADRKKFRDSSQQMADRIANLEQQIAARTAPPPQPAPKLNVTPEELSDYGEDFIGLVQRIAQHTVDGKILPLAREVGRTQAQVGMVENRSMHEQMTTLFPQWQDLNGDQRFIEWVMLPDAYSGAIRQKLMQDAWDTGDARRVNAFFQGFLAEEAALNPQGGGRQPVAAVPAAPNGAPAPVPPLSLTALAAPGGARSAQQQPAEKPVYTTEDITRFYTEVAAGRWRHRDQERSAIDADIMRAQHEGRIILNNRRYVPPEPPHGATR